MRPTSVTDQQVVEAGLQIKEAGGRVTGSAIRKLLGQGNVERMKRTWEAYVEGQGSAVPAEVPALPVEVETITGQLIESFGGEILKLAHAINQTSNRVHEKRVKEITEQASAANEQAAAELKDASSAIEELESDLERCHSEIERHERLGVDQSSKMAVLESNLEKAQERAAEADKLEKQIASLEQELHTLRAETAHNAKLMEEAETRHRDSLEQLRKDHRDSQSEAQARHQSDLDRLRADHKQQLKEIKEAHKDELEKRDKAFSQLEVSNTAVIDLNNSQKTQLAVLQEKVSSFEFKIVDEKKTRDQMRADHAKEIARLTSLIPKDALPPKS